MFATATRTVRLRRCFPVPVWQSPTSCHQLLPFCLCSVCPPPPLLPPQFQVPPRYRWLQPESKKVQWRCQTGQLSSSAFRTAFSSFSTIVANITNIPIVVTINRNRRADPRVHPAQPARHSKPRHGRPVAFVSLQVPSAESAKAAPTPPSQFCSRSSRLFEIHPVRNKVSLCSTGYHSAIPADTWSRPGHIVLSPAQRSTAEHALDLDQSRPTYLYHTAAAAGDGVSYATLPSESPIFRPAIAVLRRQAWPLPSCPLQPTSTTRPPAIQPTPPTDLHHAPVHPPRCLPTPNVLSIV